MKLILYSDATFVNSYNLPITTVKLAENVFFNVSSDDKYGIPIPAKGFGDIPKNARILYNIFSKNLCIDKNGSVTSEIISESEGYSLCRNSKIFHDRKNMSAYFRYMSEKGQHLVWLEDTVHQVAKLDMLSTLGFSTVGMWVNNISVGTIINLIHTDRYSISYTGD